MPVILKGPSTDLLAKPKLLHRIRWHHQCGFLILCVTTESSHPKCTIIHKWVCSETGKKHTLHVIMLGLSVHESRHSYRHRDSNKSTNISTHTGHVLRFCSYKIRGLFISCLDILFVASHFNRLNGNVSRASIKWTDLSEFALAWFTVAINKISFDRRLTYTSCLSWCNSTT